MIELRRSADRGVAAFGWLKSKHSFSFGRYYDPAHMGFSALRVINDDEVDAAAGFETHGHQDMEIISYVLEGQIAHKDSAGNVKTLPAGEFQLMSAGKGIYHSEFNASDKDNLKFLQIWIQPNVTGIAPSYEEKHFTPESKQGRLRLIASPDGRDGSVTIHQQAEIHAGLFDGTEQAELALDPARKAYVFLVRGSLSVNGLALQAGDAALLAQESLLQLGQGVDAEVLVFDLAP